MACWARLRCLGLTTLARGGRGGGGWKRAIRGHRGFCCCSSSTIYQCQGPMMMSPTWEYRDYDRPASFPSEEEEKDYYFFYGLSEPISHFVKVNMLPPNCRCKDEARCVGSSHGWLAFLSTNISSLSIVNPFLPPAIPSSILLPPFPIGYSDVKKLILSADPYCFLYIDKRSHTGLQLPCNYEDIVHNCTVIAIIGGPSSFDLAFSQLGDPGWTLLRGARKNYYGEIMYSVKDQCLYAMGGHREFH